MDFQKKNVRNVCSLYASKWHLTVMLLPYLSKQIEKNVKFETILKEDIIENVEELIAKLNLNKQMQESMLKINWKTSNIQGYKQIEEFMNSIIKTEKNISIILNGENREVEENNKLINKWLSKNENKIKDNEITIISCFRALENGANVEYLINNYDYTLNSSGEHKIDEIFNIYKKVISY